jgi:hypothetical protein
MTKVELTVAIKQELTSQTPELTERLRRYHRIETDTAYAVAMLAARRAAARTAEREQDAPGPYAESEGGLNSPVTLPPPTVQDCQFVQPIVVCKN